MKKAITLLAVASVFTAFTASASAVELITNGDFEGAPLGNGWTENGAFQIIGDWSGDTGGAVTTNSAWMGGYDDATDTISQMVNTAGFGTGTLTFDLTIFTADATTFDFMTVSLGGNVLDTIDLGDDTTSDFFNYSKSYDVSAFLNNGVQELLFTTTTDVSFGSSAFVDNVSLNANPVPEPASMAALGIGALALLRRKRSK